MGGGRVAGRVRPGAPAHLPGGPGKAGADGVRRPPVAGVDIAPPCEAPIYAAVAGVVVRAGPSTGYGNLIVVNHGDGTVTRYAHMFNDDVLVAVGQRVTTGQQIARVGTNGDSTGCHLHFEVQLNSQFTDPEPFLSGRGVVIWLPQQRCGAGDPGVGCLQSVGGRLVLWGPGRDHTNV
jgi:murein DD-endopeptidase MepM/ murein hydrolase activator NlpD